MEYKLYLSEFDIDMVSRILTSLQGNPEGLDLFEGLFDEEKFDIEYNNYIESLDMDGYDI